MQGGRDRCKGLQTKDLEVNVILPEGDYNFTVAARNGAGLGSKGSPSGLPCCPRALPVPRLALGVAHPAGVITADADTAEFALRPLHAPPVLMAALAAENALISVDSIGRVKRLDLVTERVSDIFDLKTRPTSIALDWIGRFLFLAEHTGSSSSIKMLDIEAEKPKLRQILVPKQGKIVKIAYHPSGVLYFNVHTADGMYRVYKGSLTGRGRSYETINVTGRRRRRRSGSGCTCPDIRSVDTFQLVPNLDKFDDANIQLIIRDTNTGTIYLTDDTLCNCDILMKTEKVDETISLAADLTNFYILSNRQGVVHMVGRYDRKSTLFKMNSSSVPQLIEPICSECQKLDDKTCVQPEAPITPLEVANIEATRIVLKLPRPIVSSSCPSPPPLPSTTFKVAASTNPEEAMALCVNSKSPCKKVSFYNEANAEDTTISLDNLVPNTRYAVHMQLQNIYSIKRNLTSKSKGITWIKTKEAAPSAPRNLTARVVSPTEVQLSWHEPAFLHSDEVEYEVHWTSSGFIGGQVRSS